ncbi:MAG TPA: sulfotransferase [Steroidobacteraceae bacterium]|nr:sulfotransferase [Steroidobacteraceae bacterium]
MTPPQITAAFEVSRSRAHAALRAGQAATAERWLRELEAQRPGDIQCLWLLGVALLEQSRIEESIAMLERALAGAPDLPEARVDLARACQRARRPAQARTEVRRVLEKMPHHHRAWLAYGDVLVDLGQYDDARIAFERARATDPERARIEEASAALTRDDRKTSEGLFREILRRDASHVGALCGLAAVSLAADVPGDAERLLRHALRQSEHLPLAYRGLGPVLLALGRVEEADAAARHLQKIEPENPQTWIVMATVASRFMRQEQALEAYQRAARYQPGDVRLLMSIGHVRKSLGQRAESEASYKEVLAADPANAEAWWSLADLKNYNFEDGEVALMQGLVADWERAGRARPGDAQLHFALGRALEQRGRYGEAFAAYVRGNAMRRRDDRFDIEAFERRAQRIRAFFGAAFFAGHAGGGDPSAAPIFIVGLPRSGSTLIEQILASHSQVDGTMELPNIVNLVRSFEDLTADRDGYPEALGGIPARQFASFGTRYLAETAPLRRGRAHFTDKLPNNFSHVGLIQGILPNATVIDARRHPMDACFSTFKQHFASGQTFSYDLEDLGRYYRCYLSLMDHWDEVLPGKVLHIQYEELVRDPQANIRRLLAHCGLPFEAGCLSFHENARAVRTPSAEQVRRPIYTSAVGHWRHYEKELEPLKRSLGDCLGRFERY